MAGEYTGGVVRDGVRKFLAKRTARRCCRTRRATNVERRGKRSRPP